MNGSIKARWVGHQITKAKIHNSDTVMVNVGSYRGDTGNEGDIKPSKCKSIQA